MGRAGIGVLGFPSDVLNGASFENLRTLTDSTLRTVTLRAFERVSNVEGKRLNDLNVLNDRSPSERVEPPALDANR
jgi:hypothetical protein